MSDLIRSRWDYEMDQRETLLAASALSALTESMQGRPADSDYISGLPVVEADTAALETRLRRVAGRDGAWPRTVTLSRDELGTLLTATVATAQGIYGENSDSHLADELHELARAYAKLYPDAASAHEMPLPAVVDDHLTTVE